MNTIFIVLPILTLLMFDLGLVLRKEDFKNLGKNPRGIYAGLIGQIIMLPIIAFFIACVVDMPDVWFLGFMLIACSPGGSSSNVFTMLIKGDIALSVVLTAMSSVLTMMTIPIVMWLTLKFLGESEISGSDGIKLPIGNLLVQNIVLVGIPLAIGFIIRLYHKATAEKIHNVLSKLAFPALVLLASIFFAQNYDVIRENICSLGIATTMLIILALICGSGIAYGYNLSRRQTRSIIIEVGMQNAAQAIMIAVSPLVFNNQLMAIPAIIYALLMNVILIIYVAYTNYKR